MALSKPRKITVNGIKYHWKVSSNGCLHLVIINPENNKQKIVVNYKSKHTIKPWHVRKYINRALKSGWTVQLNFEED